MRKIRGCPETRRLINEAKAAVQEDGPTEYLDLVIAIKVFDNVDGH